MDKILLDTDIFSEILKQKHEKVVARAEQYHLYFGFYTITTITVLEIIKGFHKAGRENHIARFLSAISGTEILTLNIKSAELAGRIYADLERTGQPIGRVDPIIAAIALENNLALSTGNISHYQRIQSAGYDLILDNWKI